jgi:hypothetical protein
VKDGRASIKFRTGGIEYGKEIDLGGVSLTGSRPAFVSTIPFTFGLFTGRKLKQTGLSVSGPKQSTLPSLVGPEGSYQVKDGRANIKFRTGGIEYGKEIDLGGVSLTGSRPAFVSTIPFTFGLFTGRKLQQTGISVSGPKQSTLPSLVGPEGSYQVKDGRASIKFRTGGIEYGKEIDLGGVSLTGSRPAFVSTIPFTFGLLTGRKMK